MNSFKSANSLPSENDAKTFVITKLKLDSNNILQERIKQKFEDPNEYLNTADKDLIIGNLFE